jgi:hypothetical protein
MRDHREQSEPLASEASLGWLIVSKVIQYERSELELAYYEGA